MKKMYLVMAFALLVGLFGSAVPGAAQAPADDGTEFSQAPATPAGDSGGSEGAPPSDEILKTITHSVSQAVQVNSIACGFPGTGVTAQNSYFRVFDLPSFGINNVYTVASVDIGVGAAQGPVGTQPVTVNLYTLSGPFVFANLTPIGSNTINLPNQDLTIVNVPVAGVAPPGSTLVVEVFTPDGQQSGSGFWIGSNAAGQTGPSYLSTPGCGGIPEPTDIATLGFPNMHIVMNVNGDEAGPPFYDLCANYFTGRVSIPHAVTGCPAGTLPLTVGPMPLTFCVAPFSGAVHWFFSNSCSGGWIPHTVPFDGPLSVCAHNWTLQLRAIYGAQGCNAYETEGVIPDVI